MKEFITLKSMETGFYKVIEIVDSRFYSLYEALEYHFYQTKFSGVNLIDWFLNEKRTVDGNEYIDIRKEKNAIAIYDISDRLNEDYIGSYIDPNPDLRFEMSRENFIELLYHWEELRISKPDTILIVIHENNHVTLETDPVVIKQYQDAGYAFDINTSDKSIK